MYYIIYSFMENHFTSYGIIENENIQQYKIIKCSRGMQKIGNTFEYTDFIAKPNDMYRGCIKCIDGHYYLYMGYIARLEYELYIPIHISKENTINIIPSES